MNPEGAGGEKFVLIPPPWALIIPVRGKKHTVRSLEHLIGFSHSMFDTVFKLNAHLGGKKFNNGAQNNEGLCEFAQNIPS